MHPTPKKSAMPYIVTVLVIIILFAAYFYYSGGSTDSSASLLTSTDEDASIGTAELSLLDQVQSLKIDPSVFSDPAYQNLQDYTVAIPDENVGRPDPFAPFAGDPSLTAPSSGGTAVKP